MTVIGFINTKFLQFESLSCIQHDRMLQYNHETDKGKNKMFDENFVKYLEHICKRPLRTPEDIREAIRHFELESINQYFGYDIGEKIYDIERETIKQYADRNADNVVDSSKN